MTGSCGCRGGGPVSSSVSTSRPCRPRTRRRSAASSAATASPRGVPPARSARPGRSRSSGPPSSTSLDNGSAEPFGPVVVPVAARGRSVGPGLPLLAPVIRGLASTDHPQLGHFTDSDVVLDFLSREKLQPLAELGTSCPDHFLRTKVRPMVLDLPADRPARGRDRAAAGAARRLPRGLRRLLPAARDAGQPGDARCRPGDRAGARRRDVLASARTRPPRALPASSTSTPST